MSSLKLSGSSLSSGDIILKPFTWLLGLADYVLNPLQRLIGLKRMAYFFLLPTGKLNRILASIAREKGLSRFVAEVLPENTGMLTVFSRSGLPMKTEHGGDAMHVTMSLTEETF